MSLKDRLEAAGFSATAAKNPRYVFCHRGEVACLIDSVTGQPGSAMVATAAGMATVMQRDGHVYLAAHGEEQVAEAEQLTMIAGFHRDLAAVLNES